MTEPLRLLMVEDQQELRELIGEALRDAGITVETADDGHSALRMLRENGPYDVVFSDIRMPNGMSGIELSEHVAQLLPQARVILASGFAKAQLPPLPAQVDFLPKPYRLRQLIDVLKGVATNA
ncbi:MULTISPECIES: response regulator [Xanthomonas]|uniref:Response regulator n=7 Tax=Xanthomonas arboricola TaxID=56448 RepID=A0AAQ0W7T4_9XANT|nr:MULTISPECIES: response regulator [Xanthomonas]GAE49720.1 two-component system regulatory protein [Xanthomonas arboricola pv. pruni str. MAFF 311562]GAE60461.1 two-component system regulatory protein [Xanthomonas arboricola pv. pruni MAFF 301427]AKU49182.1 chemotaxis protein CheY [Xanthomonas arboricola pv. juglandis]KCX00377.1 chemotaxis protein CheY [Xanthomonas arboricola pv. pruni]KER82404.1 chemotaxis protein CheY [Xanthomonas arboricola pv. celebensis]